MAPYYLLLRIYFLLAIAAASTIKTEYNITVDGVIPSRNLIRSAKSDKWFTQLEDVTYSMVHHIPGIGTLYSFKRAGMTYSERDWVRHWQSVSKFLQGSIRDIALIAGVSEPFTVALVHDMAEAFSDKMIEIYHSNEPKVHIDKRLDKEDGHILIAEPAPGKVGSKVFTGLAKGLHHFHGAVFEGDLRHPKYSPQGTKIQLHIPQGIFPGARFTFTWKWPVDYWGSHDVPDATLGLIRLEKGQHTKFGLSERKGMGGWAGLDFWGWIMTKDHIIAKTRVGGLEVDINFWRVKGT